MTTQRKRLLELALESLQKKKSELDREIETVMHEMQGTQPVVAPERAKAARRRPKLSKAERLRRSARMRAYWEMRRRRPNT